MGGGSRLPPHVDRAQCEWTLSLSIDVNPSDETCPVSAVKQPKKLTKEKSFGAKNAKPKDPEKYMTVYAHPGDAAIFRGRGLVHWRDTIPDKMNCTNVFLHYVREEYMGRQE